MRTEHGEEAIEELAKDATKPEQLREEAVDDEIHPSQAKPPHRED